MGWQQIVGGVLILNIAWIMLLIAAEIVADLRAMWRSRTPGAVVRTLEWLALAVTAAVTAAGVVVQLVGWR